MPATNLMIFIANALLLLMFSSAFNWRTGLAAIAILIVIGTIFYSNFLAKKIAANEKIKVEQWVQAINDINNNTSSTSNLAGKILTENSRDIPMITVAETDSILDHYNLDTDKISKDPLYLKKQLSVFKQTNDPVVWVNPLNPSQTNYVYFGESDLLIQIKYFPIVQLIIVGLFILLTLIAIGARNRSTQNQVWVGMAKETAHQLGTPISSLEGWIEMLKTSSGDPQILAEMHKDVSRLKLVSDRFGKIGSKPQLEPTNIINHVEQMVSYIKGRAGEKIKFNVIKPQAEFILANINPQLFDWVIENLLKNALDATEGKGKINITIKNDSKTVTIDITDSGKGVLKKNIPHLFKPGFTTKKRGWGLGLSLSKRIIEEYHKGQLFLKMSEPNNETTFRIILNQ
jgi:signal transduction histidine kinase